MEITLNVGVTVKAKKLRCQRCSYVTVTAADPNSPYCHYCYFLGSSEADVLHLAQGEYRAAWETLNTYS